LAATVFTRKVNGPAAHALVIGVGHYPHLPGGAAATKIANTEGMGQLASPPRSARSFARWLIERYQSPTRPLASLALLTSEKAPSAFVFRPLGKDKDVSVAPAPASMAEVENAINDWYALGDANPDNLLLFYFCGHGIAAGLDLALLMSDFGAKPKSPLTGGAMDFRRFHAGMEECRARHQCYFIDACQVGSDRIVRNAGFAGIPVIEWSGEKANPDGRTRLGPIFYSTMPDQKAYARAGQESVFTGALLEALAGGGSGDESGDWNVQVGLIQHALTQLMTDASERLNLPLAQVPHADLPGEVTLNTLVEPSVPVFVRVDPADAHAVAALRCEGTVKNKRKPHPTTWHLSLPMGKYDFYADFKANTYQADPRLNEDVRPPYWRKPLKAH